MDDVWTEYLRDSASPADEFWRCPNEPPCEHGGTAHDYGNGPEPAPVCCVEGCECRPRVREEAR